MLGRRRKGRGEEGKGKKGEREGEQKASVVLFVAGPALACPARDRSEGTEGGGGPTEEDAALPPASTSATHNTTATRFQSFTFHAQLHRHHCFTNSPLPTSLDSWPDYAPACTVLGSSCHGTKQSSTELAATLSPRKVALQTFHAASLLGFVELNQTDNFSRQLFSVLDSTTTPLATLRRTSAILATSLRACG